MESQLKDQNYSLIIRKMEATDIAGVLEIQSETNLSVWSKEDYSNEIEREDSIFKVTVLDNKIVGFAVIRLLIGNDGINFETAEILNIAVRKSFQSQQVGQGILDEILVEIESLNIKEIWLEVRKSNVQAINFYNKNNFKQKFIRKNYYNNPTENALVLVKQ